MKKADQAELSYLSTVQSAWFIAYLTFIITF